MNADAVVQGCLTPSLEQRHQVNESVTFKVLLSELRQGYVDFQQVSVILSEKKKYQK